MSLYVMFSTRAIEFFVFRFSNIYDTTPFPNSSSTSYVFSSLFQFMGSVLGLDCAFHSMECILTLSGAAMKVGFN